MPSSKPASLKAPLILGIVNVTDDSFHAASRTPEAGQAVGRALALVEEGADWLDIGGQSTRPGSDPVSESAELARVVPVVEALAALARVPISVDTDKAEVARQARQAGATILNDVSAFRADAGMIAEAALFDSVIVMHRGGESPKTMQQAPRYDDVSAEVLEFLAERNKTFAAAGGDPERLIFDPGIGFGKDLSHNLSLLKHLRKLKDLGPVALGASRKSFLGRITPDAGPEERLEGSLAVACWAALEGVKILRVHDVRATKRALDVLAAIGEAR